MSLNSCRQISVLSEQLLALDEEGSSVQRMQNTHTCYMDSAKNYP